MRVFWSRVASTLIITICRIKDKNMALSAKKSLADTKKIPLNIPWELSYNGTAQMPGYRFSGYLKLNFVLLAII